MGRIVRCAWLAAIAAVVVACGAAPRRDAERAPPSDAATDAFDRAAADPAVTTYPGTLHVHKTMWLGAPERAVELRAVRDLEGHLDRYASRYLAEHPHYIGADEARELFPEYAASPATRMRFTMAVQGPSTALVDLVWRRVLADPVTPRSYVLLTAGGPGSGKTTVLDQEEKPLADGAAVIYDSTFSHPEANEKRIAEARASGRDVIVLYVHRPIELEIEGIVLRAISVGRSVTVRGAAERAFAAQAAFIAEAEQHASEHVRFVAVDNSGGIGTAHRIDLDALRALRYASREDVLDRARAAFDDVWARSKPSDPAQAEALRRAMLAE